MAQTRAALGISLLALGLAFGPSLGKAKAAPTCPSTGSTASVVAAVESRLELKLADGRRLRLAGLDPGAPTPAQPELDEATRARLAEMLAGKPVTLLVLAPTPDRWGRLPAFVFAAADPPGGVATAAIAAGLGRYLAEPAAAACRESLLAAERRARDAKLGLWRDPYYGVLAVDDRSGFAERSATLVLAEGPLVGLRSSPYRTTLRFAAPAGRSYMGHMLVATITPRVMKRFESEGVNMQALIGRRLRIRGLLDTRFGPRIELQGPEQIEVLDAPTPPGPHVATVPNGAD